MEKNNLIHCISVILLLTSAILHMLAPLFFGFTLNAFALMVGGIIYAILVVALIFLNKKKIVRLFSFLIVAIGLSLGLIMMFTSDTSDANLIQITISYIYICLAILVILLRLYLYIKITE